MSKKEEAIKITKPGFYITTTGKMVEIFTERDGIWYGYLTGMGTPGQWFSNGENINNNNVPDIISEWPAEMESFERYLYLNSHGDIVVCEEDWSHRKGMRRFAIRITPDHPDPKKRVEVIE